MFLLQIEIPSVDDLMGYSIVLIILTAFVGFWLYRKQKRKQQEEVHVNYHWAFSSSFEVSSFVSSQEDIDDDDDDTEAPSPISDVAEALDIKEWQVKIILGIPIIGVCQAQTAEEAEDSYQDSDEGSDEEYLALAKWIELEDDFDQMSELEEIVENTPLYSLYERRFNELSEKMSVDNFSERKLVDNFVNTLVGSSSEKKIVQKLFDIYKKQY